MAQPHNLLPVTGSVDSRGVVHLTGRDGRSLTCDSPRCPFNLLAKALGLLNAPIEAILKRHRASKSRDQLAWYWGAILPALADRTGYTLEEMHAWCAYKFLNPPERKTLEIADANGEIVEYADVQVVPDRVSLLTTAQMADYCDDIRRFAADRLQVFIEDPDKHWKRNRADKARLDRAVAA